MYVCWVLVSRRILSDAVSEMTLLTAIAFAVCKRIVPFALLRTVVIVVFFLQEKSFFGCRIFWSCNEQIDWWCRWTQRRHVFQILAFLHIVTKSQAINTSIFSFQNDSLLSGILNNITRGRIMHISIKATFDFAALTLLWDKGTESWGLITRFGMTQCLGWFSVLTCFCHLASFPHFDFNLYHVKQFITFPYWILRVPSYLQPNLIQKFGHNTWN